MFWFQGQITSEEGGTSGRERDIVRFCLFCALKHFHHLYFVRLCFVHLYFVPEPKNTLLSLT